MLNSSGHAEESLNWFCQALDLASAQANDNLTVDAAHMLGVAEKDIDRQIEWDKKALAMVAASQDLKVQRWKVPLYYNLDWSMDDGHHFADALSAFQDYLALTRARGLPDDPEVSNRVAELQQKLGE